MADSKITALDNLTAADPVNDMFPIVDVSDTTMAASGTTKRISVNNILGASGTATLASATITGDLTVKTNVLKVDSTNNRVGIGTATPAKRCEINQSANAFITIGDGEIIRLIGDDGNTIGRVTELGFGSGPSGGTFAPVIIGAINTNVTAFGRKDIYFATRPTSADTAPVERYRIASDGVATWSNVGGVAGTAMTLNSTSNLVLRGGTSGANGVGLTFPATQVASSDANCLDDYEEGTWTPVVADASTGGNVGTCTINTATYTKIGRQVSIQCDLRSITTTGMTGGNKLFIRGLPFASVKGGNGNFYTYRVGRNASTVSSEVSVEQGVSYAFLSLFTASSANTNLSILVSDIVSGTSELALSVTYTV